MALDHLRLEPDYGCVLLLWSRDGQASELAEELLSAGLRADLEAWQRTWESSYLFPTGWVSDDARMTWSRRGEELYLGLLQEVWDDYEVEPGFRRIARHDRGRSSAPPSTPVGSRA